MRNAMKLILVSMAMVFGVITSAFADDWSGDWDTNHGQLRLLKNGDRLYGDYAERGTIEGRISPDGHTARAVFLYTDGRWGTVEWRRANDRLGGTWNWNANGLPDPKSGNNWTGTRTSARTSQLKFAGLERVGYPLTDPNFTEGAYRGWLGERNTPINNDPRRDTGDMYGGYEALQIEGAFDINIDVIAFRDFPAAFADISFYSFQNGNCPSAMHVDFCEEISAKADDRGYVDVTTTGAHIVNNGLSDAVEIAFRLPGDRADRMMVIGREATYFRMSIIHPTRGYDFVGFARGRKHVCDTDQCTNDAFIDLRQNPDRNLGKFNDERWNNRMLGMRNDIAQSHRSGVRPAPNPAPNPAPMPTPTPPAPSPQGGGVIGDVFVILDETSENLGNIVIGCDLRAKGELLGMFDTAEPNETVFTLIESTNESAVYDLITYAGQSGEQKSGRLLVELPSNGRNNPRGTLVVGDDIFNIELSKPLRGLDPEDVGDRPAIGVYGPKYALRDIPNNRSMVLRKSPDRGSAETGRLSPNTSGLDVLACQPEINAQRFEAAERLGKLRLLSTSWCQITNNEFAGWLPGRYLDPR